jgi:hypothetical protein
MICPRFTFCLLASATLLVVLGVTSPAVAQEIPRILSYQGQLLDDGQPVEETINVTFQLFTSETDNTSIDDWQENREVTPENGVFSVLLGDTNNEGSRLPDNLSDEEALYLGVFVDGAEVDRLRLTSTVYAFGAERARTAGFADEAGQAQRAAVAGEAESVSAEAAVTSLNAFTGEVAITAGANITVGVDTAGEISISAVTQDGGLQNVNTNDTLEGDGTSDSALGVADNAVGNAQLANETALRSLNGLQDNVTLAADGLDVSADDETLTLSIADGAVATAQLANEAVTTDKLEDAAITTAKLAGEAVTAGKLAEDAAVSSLNELTGAVEIAEGSGIELGAQDNALVISVAEEFGVFSITAGAGLEASSETGDVDLSIGEVTEDLIADGAVTEDKLSTTAVSTSKIANGAITNAKLRNGVVSGSKIQAEAVSTSKIADLAVTSEKLESNAAILSITDENDAEARGDVTFLSTDGTVDIEIDGQNIDFSSSSLSASRYKEAVEKLENPVELLSRLRGVRYTWRESGEADVGMIADEVAEVLPELVSFNEAGEATRLHYGRLVAVLVEVAKKQQQDMADMEQRIQRLERLVDYVAPAASED